MGPANLLLFRCVGLSGQMQMPETTLEFMNAACQGNLDVIDKYLADGGNPNVHDEVRSPRVTRQMHSFVKFTSIYYSHPSR